MKNGNSALTITPIHASEYCTVEAFFVQNNALYSLHIVGEKNAQPQIQATTEKILDIF